MSDGDLTMPLDGEALLVLDPYPLADSVNFQLRSGEVPLQVAERWLSRTIGADVKLQHAHGDRFAVWINGVRERDTVEIKLRRSRKKRVPVQNPINPCVDILAHNAGARECRRNRLTGTTITLYDGYEAGIATPPEYRWCTVCEEHGTMVCHPTQTIARSHMAVPEWCEPCGVIMRGES